MTPDTRSIRDICLSIEASLKNPAPATKNYPSRLSEEQREALQLVFEDNFAKRGKGKSEPMTIRDVMAAMNSVSPGCVTSVGGDFSDSVRACAAEFLGLNVSWRAPR